MRKVAVTGGLSTGKTTVCQLFKALGAYVVSADEIAHRLLSPGTPQNRQVAELLGLQAGQLSRELIASLVFNDPGKLAKLEAILHPALFDEIENTYNQIDHHLYPLFIAEIPLLYETNQEGRFDTIVAVLADEPLCKLRFSKTEYSARMRRQLPPSLKAAKAHYVLINNGSIDELKTQVQSLYFQLTQ